MEAWALSSSAAQTQHAEKVAAVRMQYAGSGLTAVRYNYSHDANWRENAHHKLIHFVRHCQGYHNLLGDVSRKYGAEFSETGEYEVAIKEQCPYMIPAIQDPPLTAIGRDDAKNLRTIAAGINPELVVASPMRRAVETALIGFPVKGRHGRVPIIAHEGCREQMGVFLCDKRSDVTDYQEDGRYDRVDYSLIATDADTSWHPTSRESMLAMAHRAEDFLKWLMCSRPEREIMIVTHSAWLMAVFTNLVLNIQPSIAVTRDGTDSDAVVPISPVSSGGATAVLHTPEEELAWMKTFFFTGEVRSLLVSHNGV